MKKAILSLCFSLCCLMMFGQSNPLRQVIVVMAEQHNPIELSRKTQFMDKAHRRDFVIAECKAFCEASQAEVLDFIASLGDEVQEIEPYWAFNGIACLASEDAIRLIEERQDVDYVYRDEPKKMIPDSQEGNTAASKGNAWHVDQIHAPEVWNYHGTTGYDGTGILVAVIDSGVDYNHIDIAGSMWDGGEIFPHHGYDMCHDDYDPMDDFCHGTHVAGIIAGQGNAGTQTGIAPGAKIMAIKVLDETGYGTDSDVISGIHFAMNHGADIINISAGSPGVGAMGIYRQVFESVDEAGMVAAVAAGNVGDAQYAYPIPNNVNAPGNCPPPWLHPDQVNLISGGTSAVISVGATDNNDKHCDFSSVGPVTWASGQYVGNYNDYPYQNGDASQPGLIRPDISAPGKNITSLNYLTGSGYIAYDGTSMATPCVSGVLALLLQANPELNAAELDSIIELTAVKIGNNKKNNIFGSGRIDALEAINALFHTGPTNLSINVDDEDILLNWAPCNEAVSYNVFRDGIRIANDLTMTTYTDHLSYAGFYTYYVTAVFSDGTNSLPSNYVNIDKVVVVEAEVINGKRVALSWNLAPGIFEDFESGDFYQNMWVNDASSPWQVTTIQPMSGNYCAKSVNTGMFSTSKISLAVNNPTTTEVSYYARISCFPLNGGGFFIDNVQYGETIKDEVPWTNYSVSLAPGNHLLEWKYANQLAEGDYDNAFYIDDITVGNIFSVLRADCDGNNTVLIASNLSEAEYVDYSYEHLGEGNYKYGVKIQGSDTVYWSDCIEYVSVPEIESLKNIRRITVVTTLGQVLYDGNASEDISTKLLHNYPSGIYIVTLHTDQGVVTKKVCK